MALVNVIDMEVLDNPTCFLNPFQFQITFECLQELDDDLEWKVLYVGSAQDATRDQILDEVLVGPVPVGINKFILQADAPDPSQLAQEDLLGVTVVLVTCSYKEREFVRVGYYVNNEYHDPNAPPPAPSSTTTAAATTTMNATPVVANDDKDETNNTGADDDEDVEDEDDDDDDDDDGDVELDGGKASKEQEQSQSSQQKSQEQQQQSQDNQPVLPNPIPLDRIQRQILADKPRVTKFPIPWGTGGTDEEMADDETNGLVNATNGNMPHNLIGQDDVHGETLQQQQQQQQYHQQGQQQQRSDVVSMQEESNTSFGGGVQAMAE